VLIRCGLLALALSCALLAGVGTAAAADLALTAGTSQLPVAPGLAVFRDPGGAMTLEQARQAFSDGRFQASQRPWPAFGFTPDAVWVRFAVRDESNSARLWLTELRTARMDELDWYLLREGGVIEHLSAGNLRERSPEMVDCKNPVFPLQLAAGESAEVFLRVHSETALHLPLRIWDTKTFAGAQAGNEAIFTAFFGYLAALTLMSLVFSLFTRDRGYLIYSLSLIGVFGLYFAGPISCHAFVGDRAIAALRARFTDAVHASLVAGQPRGPFLCAGVVDVLGPVLDLAAPVSRLAADADRA
jgi:hypothetical protein